MSIYSTFDAYDHLEVGRKIGVYDVSPYGAFASKNISDGVITELHLCGDFVEDCLPCRYKIRVDNGRLRCMRYADRTAIRYVIVPNVVFIEEGEMEL